MELDRDSGVFCLIDSYKMPVYGFGTYAPEKFPKNLAKEGTKVAIEVGYRHIDCAYIYDRELPSTFHPPERVRLALEKSLKDLQLDYMDLFHSFTFRVECHIYLNQSKLLEFCKSKDIVLVGYNQNSPVLLEDPILNSIAKKLHRTPAQVAMRYLLNRGVIVLAKSFTPARIKENIQVFDFHLSDDDMKVLDGLNKNLRYFSIDRLKDHPNFPFHDEY
ncbi:hypothetical protein GDO86_005053 [Hymenochirus boettgeri]|uniref:NADP-dependent oxidoreductase domain-containing protein n=1 Tax=Hymenochirus boettgeri TaxID=247094 RepID=A0A8T2J347_9PIPI|nr:hypothetical protein GDO86_005053 [Hymenochirus boettgeri]